jgi:asparagine synthase (glutamine-hydrolysing)
MKQLLVEQRVILYYGLKFQLYQIIKDHQPKEILKRKKQGFVGPDIYYQNSDWYKNIIDNSITCDKNIINKETLYKLLNNKEYWKLWKFAVFETWYKTWM